MLDVGHEAAVAMTISSFFGLPVKVSSGMLVLGA